MDTALFDYDLPPALIAQSPAEPRDSSRLLVLHRADGRIEHRTFRDIVEYLNPRDLLVANNSRVIPARLHGRKATGGAVELFLLRQLDEDGAEWECLVGGKGLIPGATVTLADGLAESLTATITFVSATGTRHMLFSAPIRPYLDDSGRDTAAALYYRLHGRQGALPDGLQPAGRQRGRADRRAALYAGAAAGDP